MRFLTLQGYTFDFTLLVHMHARDTLLLQVDFITTSTKAVAIYRLFFAHNRVKSVAKFYRKQEYI